METVVVACPDCTTSLSAPTSVLGKRVKCKLCGARFVAAARAGAPAGAPTATLDDAGLPPPAARSVRAGPVPLGPTETYDDAALHPKKPKSVAGTPDAPPREASGAALPVGVALAAPSGRRWSGGNWAVALTTAALVLAGTGLAFAFRGPGRTGGPVAGIEISSKGVTYTVIDPYVDEETGAYAFNLRGTQSSNTSLISGLKEKGEFQPANLRAAAEDALRFRHEVMTDWKVPPDRIHFAVSSSLANVFDDVPDEAERTRRVRHSQDLLSEALRGVGIDRLTFVNLEEEVRYAFDGVIPKKYSDQALYLDVGSGSIKGGYFEQSGRIAAFALPYGLRTFNELVKGGPKNGVRARAAARAAERIGPAVERVAETKPGVVNRERVYLAGGVVWAMATLLHPEDRGVFVELKPEDFEAFAELVGDDARSLPEPDLSRLDPKARQEAEKDLRNIKERLGTDLPVGAELLKALAKEARFSAPGRKVFFPRYGYLGWLLTFVAEQEQKK